MRLLSLLIQTVEASKQWYVFIALLCCL